MQELCPRPATLMGMEKTHGKAALITGAASGIGRGLALELAVAGVALTGELTLKGRTAFCKPLSIQCLDAAFKGLHICAWCCMHLIRSDASLLTPSWWPRGVPSCTLCVPALPPPVCHLPCPRCPLLQWPILTAQQQSRWHPRSGTVADGPLQCPVMCPTPSSTWRPFAGMRAPGASWTMRC